MGDDTPVTVPVAEPPTPAPPEARVSFFTLDPRKIGRSRLVRALAIGLVVVSFSIVPLWRLFWYLPVYPVANFLPVRDAGGRVRAAWHWIDGREIRIYTAPDVRPEQGRVIAEGVEAAVREAGLAFDARVLPMPPTVEQAYRDSLVTRRGDDGTREWISFHRLAANLITLREGDPHADILVVKTPMTECWWAHGMASFTYGVGVMQDNAVSYHLGKHETCHLLGYHYHDTLPLFVIGYPWEGLPWQRDTLMVLYGGSTDLSPRARDALHYFWRGMERRSGKAFLARDRAARPEGAPGSPPP